MKKRTFGLLVLGTLGGLLFSLGLCMCMLPQWDAFDVGVGSTAVGILLLTALMILARKGKARAKIDWRLAGKIAYGVVSTLVLGAGMCMILVFDMLLWGIVMGVAGILMLLGLIPMCIGLR